LRSSRPSRIGIAGVVEPLLRAPLQEVGAIDAWSTLNAS